jgi:hypothetical protein
MAPFVFRSGWSRVTWVVITSNSAWALSTETPGFSRPTTANVFPHLSVSAVIGNGTSRSIRAPGEKTDAKSKEAGSTPITVSDCY